MKEESHLQEPKRLTNYGPIRGSHDCGMPTAFYGVPFARVSGNHGRFRPASPPDAWIDELHATLIRYRGQSIPSSRADPKHLLPRHACTQQITSLVVGIEPCLQLLIYLPYSYKNQSSNEAASNPAMVWFHGGWSVAGEAWGLLGHTDGALFALIQNISVLAAQYRLALFGLIVLD